MRFSALILLGVLAAASASAQNACSWSRDVRLTNGTIHTLSLIHI